MMENQDISIAPGQGLPPILHTRRASRLDTVEYFNLVLELKLNDQEKKDPRGPSCDAVGRHWLPDNGTQWTVRIASATPPSTRSGWAEARVSGILRRIDHGQKGGKTASDSGDNANREKGSAPGGASQRAAGGELQPDRRLRGTHRSPRTRAFGLPDNKTREGQSARPSRLLEDFVLAKRSRISIHEAHSLSASWHAPSNGACMAFFELTASLKQLHHRPNTHRGRERRPVFLG